VCGWDVVRFGHHVRRYIGVTSQFAAIDDAMTGRGNLELVARLLGASKRESKARAHELIGVFDLVEAADRRAVTYSGGMRRRLDLAVSLLGRPEVLFLDEPTTGLDPVSRDEVWRFVAGLAANGTTVVLTTQYLEEADRLADDVVVLAGGHVVASGTPAKLKADLGERTATVRFAVAHDVPSAVAVLLATGMSPVADEQQCTVTVALAAAGDVALLVRAVDAAGIAIRDLSVAEPTLTDVYLSLHRNAWQKALA
jgi:ABC-2 type transport system ATP-binding protein